jgi:hypothetical protein
MTGLSQSHEALRQRRACCNVIQSKCRGLRKISTRAESMQKLVLIMPMIIDMCTGVCKIIRRKRNLNEHWGRVPGPWL